MKGAKNKILLFIISLGFCLGAAEKAAAQNAYIDSLQSFRDHYINAHEVVQGEARKSLRFFSINPTAQVKARIEFPEQSPWFTMATSSGMKKAFRIYAYAHFQWNDTTCRLAIYQSQGLLNDAEYADYLFLPFTDLSNTSATYEMGRYIDLKLGDIQQKQLTLDFNKAYNPYCAYSLGQFNCPIPPAENDLPVFVDAGEMSFLKKK